MSPSANFLIYDNKFDSYLVYFKFGDTKRDDRDRAYSTHNPSIVYKGRKDTRKGLGKATEKNTLEKLVKELKEYGIVQGVGTTTIGKSRTESEWYEIYLGRSKEKAYAAKAELRRLLHLYGDESNKAGPHGGKSHEEYLEEFLSLFPPIDKAKVGTAQGGTKATKKPVIGKDARGPEQPDWWKIAKVDILDRPGNA
ncbi:hypothetical protein C0993_012651 [Termitomyces sp. T159_Od127]|nr:hypothetical protein C0993_012651 [Termitomyces sp. T159_Od127]